MTTDQASSSIITSALGPLVGASRTVPDRVRARAQDHPDRIAVIDGVTGEELSYGDLLAAVDRGAAALGSLGVKAGEVVALQAPNSPSWIVAALSTMACGAAVTGINPAYGPDEVAVQADAARARFLVSTTAGLESMPAELVSSMTATLTLDAGPRSFGSLPVGTGGPAGAVDPDSCCALPFSSGTSGHPKGVVVTHRSVGAVVDQVNACLPTEGEVVLAFLPMFHIFGFSVVTLAGLCGGATLVTLPTFDPPQFLTALSTHRVTQLFVVPPVMGFLAGHPMVDGFDLTSLDLIGCGAAPLPSSVEARVAERLDCQVAQGFGMTESSGIITLPVLGASQAGSCGQLVPGTEARVIVPGTDQDVEPGDEGELWFRGPQSAQGYLDDPEATQQTFGTDGWVRTGDIARFDEGGHLFITDRLKELIKVKGYQVAPAELEAVLVSHPQVQDAAVIGIPDERNGEAPLAFVVGEDLDPEAIRAWVGERVVDYKALARVEVCDAIPKNPSGKILRRVLRDRVSIA